MTPEPGSWHERVDEALKDLTVRATHISRESSEGQLIEHIGCILSGRNGSWWPDKDGAEPMRDDTPSFLHYERVEQSPYLVPDEHQGSAA